jgi:hypothetical protein
MANKEDIQVKINAAVESADAAKSLGQLRKSLLEIQTLQAELGDGSGAEFDKLSQASSKASIKLAETKDKLEDIRDATTSLKGTAVERLTGSFGLLKQSLFDLDFDKAKIGANGLINAFTPVVDGKLITGLSGLKGAFGMLADGVKTLGSTFLSVGKALLTNPIFLLAAAIIAIVAVVVLIMDKLGILKKIMDALGYAIGLVVKAFQALTDWLGLTTHAQEKAAEAAKKNGEEQRKQIDATAEKQKNLAKLTEGLTQAEVDALKKKAGIKDAINQNSFDIEKNRLIQTQATLKKEIDALKEIEAAGGDLTDEQKKDLDQRKSDYDKNAADIKNLEYSKVAYIENLNRTLTTTLEGWKVKNMANDVERAKAQAQLDKDAELRKIEIAKRDATLHGDTKGLELLKQTELEITKFYANAAVKIQKDADEKSHTESVNAAKKAADKKATQAAQGITDLETKLKVEIAKINQKAIAEGKEGTAEVLKQINDAEKANLDEIIKYRRDHAEDLGFYGDKSKAAKERGNRLMTLIELESKNELDKKEKEIDLKLAGEKKDRDLQALDSTISIARKEFEEKVKLTDDKNAIDEAQKKFDSDLFDAHYKQLKVQYDYDIAAAQGNADKIAAINYKLSQDIAALNNSNDEEYLNREAQKTATKLANLQYDYDNEALYSDKKLKNKKEKQAELDALNTAEADALAASKAAELANLDLDETQKADIIEKYRQLDLERKARATEKQIELNQRAYKNGVELAQKGAAAAQSIADAIFAFKKRDSSRSLAQQKKDAEAQFKVNKAIQISTAIITGIQSVMSAFANGMKNPIPLLGPATAGVYAVIAGITAAANVAKIAATKFDDSSFTPPDTGGGAGGNNGTTPESAPTNFQPNQFFGLGQQTAAGMPGGPKPIKVYVTEHDITHMQDQVQVIEQRAKLGP